MQKRKILDRFVEKIELDPATGCWNWTASLTKKGYGQFAYGERKMGAHQASWLIFKGHLDPALEIDHFFCRNRKCVNPNHLRQITHFENTDSNRRKTSCDAGHSYEEFGFYVLKTKYGTGTGRACKECFRLRRAKREGVPLESIGTREKPRARTHCVNGHNLDEVGFTLKNAPNGRVDRLCNLCRKQTQIRHNEQRRASRAANGKLPWKRYRPIS